MFTLITPLSAIKARGLGAAVLARLSKFGITTVKDLLWHFPSRYEDFSRMVPIAEVSVGEAVTISGVVTDIKMIRTWKRRMFLVEAKVTDDTGTIKAVWFNQRFLITALKKGTRVNLAGKVSQDKKNGLLMSHPSHEIVRAQTNADNMQTHAEIIPRGSASSPRMSASWRHTGRLVPVYPETRRLTSKMFRYLIKPLFASLDDIPDPLPESLRSQHQFPELRDALSQIHFPVSLDEAKRAKQRFIFEDLFLLQLTNLRQRLELIAHKAYPVSVSSETVDAFLAQLPFSLTGDQRTALDEVLRDMAKPRPMNRLLQGDVGSGKTMVAALAALAVAHEGKQSAFMAPTEVLARQHYLTFTKFFTSFDQGVALMTSSECRVFFGDGLESDLKKQELSSRIREGKVCILIGTHALLQKHINFHDLALVVIDEQHRFGVNQRKALVAQTNADDTQTDADLNTMEGDTDFLYKDLTYQIRGAIFAIRRKIGLGHKEVIYQKALAEELHTAGLSFEKEKAIEMHYDGKKIGIYRPDFVIDGKVILEVKSLPSLGKFENRQTWHYLKGSDYKLALLVNFGGDDAEIKRVVFDVARGQRVSASSQRTSAILPHFLSMSATPIPRTLTLTVFGDLDLSLINELPKGRKEIITKIVDPANRDKAYAFIRGQVKKGRQVFVICPRIDKAQTSADDTQNDAEGSPRESALSPRMSALWEVKAVKEEYEKLKKQIFPDLRVAMLHGKLKAKEKEHIMSEFRDGNTDVLVATSVVEVGVDVPNATIMMIEGSDRFGLSQLYQFRGRVGRGEHQSFCFLFTDSLSAATRARMQSLVDAKNGFELAEKDLELRGPGELLGTSQTGVPDLIMKALRNKTLIAATREAAAGLLRQDPNVKQYPALRERLVQFAREIHLE